VGLHTWQAEEKNQQRECSHVTTPVASAAPLYKSLKMKEMTDETL
jgi:hypothetical protein